MGYLLGFIALLYSAANVQPSETLDWKQVVGEFKNVKLELAHLTDGMKYIQQDNVDIKFENNKLKKDNMVLEKKLNDLQLETQELRKSLVRMEQKCHTKEDADVVKDKRQIYQPVAFTAVLDHDVTLGPHQTVIFDTIITNVGNGYEPRDGQFIAPVFGIYVISVTICSQQHSAVHVEVVKNGVQMAAIYGDDYDLGSQTLIIQLNENDRVWVRHFIDAGTGYINNESDRHYTTFSGALLVEL